MKRSLSASTAESYQRNWSSYLTFCSEVLKIHSTFPSSQHNIAMFITHLHDKGLAYRTIKTYLSAISFIHKLHNVPDPCATFLVTKALQGVKNMPSQGRRPLRPITKDILNRMTQALQHTVITHYDRLLWTAVFSLSFHACLRASEAVQSNTSTHTLQLHQIKLLPNSLTISFSSYKHSAHNTPDLTIQADPCSISCPIAALSQYLTARGTSSGPLFSPTLPRI